ncbi:MAG TPA: hypothetical protein VFC68_05005 [Treponemataceae bacterium]|nr:hypothetical protein [Treponemataceae bacterium]
MLNLSKFEDFNEFEISGNYDDLINKLVYSKATKTTFLLLEYTKHYFIGTNVSNVKPTPYCERRKSTTLKIAEPLVLAVDFDGTLCKSRYPEIGEQNIVLIDYLKYHSFVGNKLILWTCREGADLLRAINWCNERHLYFDAVNQNLQEMIDKYGNDCRKIGADIYIDDKAIRARC